MEAFAETLKPHQRAVTADGTTVLDKAVIDHNLAAASKLYNNIYFTELGQLLGCSEEQAEATASQMVMEERLQVGLGVLLNGTSLLTPSLARSILASQSGSALMRSLCHMSAGGSMNNIGLLAGQH